MKMHLIMTIDDIHHNASQAKMNMLAAAIRQ
jgi:hypothetical protein